MNTLNNQVNLIGFLGADPEIKNFDSSKKASFRIATNDSYKDKNGEWVTQTEWHQVIAWGKVSDTIEKMLKKGHQVAVSGKLTYRTYEDKEGHKRNTTEVLLKDFLKLTKDKNE